MQNILSLAIANFTTPAVLFFGLGLTAGFAKSDLSIPESVVKAMSLYLLMAIGFKGGAAAAATGVDHGFLAAAGAGLMLSVAMPFVAVAALRLFARLDRTTAAGVAAHYGSISVVTFVAAMEFAKVAGLAPGGYLAAVAALMETPGIVAALFLAGPQNNRPSDRAHLLREVLLNGSVVLLVGSFAIGLITGERGLTRLEPFVAGLFQGALCLFLLEMGLLASKRLSGGTKLTVGLVAAAIVIPLAGAALALCVALALGLAAGDTAIVMTLAASASYIAAPAAIRTALPAADPGVYLPMAIGVTFPFNIAIGIPLYAGIAQALVK